ncbi:hypothetical protein ACFTAO_10430 [Paenibacillus rhizoplanae]
MELHEALKKVRSREDFTAFLGLLAKDYSANPGEWENGSVELYLEGVQSWVEDMDGYYENLKRPAPQNIDWSFIAGILYAGKKYTNEQGSRPHK